MSDIQIIKTVSGLRQALARVEPAKRVALVPTMGNLHAGHLSLVHTAQQHADFVVTSIFINPLQFTPGSDYDTYPRTLDQDCLALAENNVDVVFAPSVEEMYPNGHAAARVTVDEIAQQLCGEHRPGHFPGVTTVVSMLLNLVEPDIAVFGEKDYQQLAQIRRMVSDLHMLVEIMGVPIARAEDGLALSSRNQYLTPDERARAPQLYASLQRAAEQLRLGERNFEKIEAQGANFLQENGFPVDYVAIRTPELGTPQEDSPEFLVLVAAHLGKARLIDNLRVDPNIK